MNRAALQTYGTQQVMTSSPVKLIALLYDKAIVSLKEAIQAIEAGEIEKRWKSNGKAIDIIQHLASTLDHEAGGEISATGGSGGVSPPSEPLLQPAAASARSQKLRLSLCMPSSCVARPNAAPRMRSRMQSGRRLVGRHAAGRRKCRAADTTSADRLVQRHRHRFTTSYRPERQ